MAATPDVRVTVECAATPEQVWAGLVTDRGGWWPDLDLEAVPGGAVLERWTEDDGVEHVASGRVLVAEQPNLLVFEWGEHGWHGRSTVRIAIEPTPGATLLVLSEDGLLAATGDPGRIDSHLEGWQFHLTRLAAVVER